MSGKPPMMAVLGLNVQAMPDRDTCLSMMQEIMWEASRMPEQHLPAKEITVRYHTVMHWLQNKRALTPAERADIIEEPSIPAYIGRCAWEAIGEPRA